MSHTEPTEAQIETAIAWQLATTEAPLSAAEAAAFAAWLQQDPRHQLAWQRIHSLHEAASLPLAQTSIQEVAALHQQNVFVAAKPYLQTYLGQRKGLILSLLLVGLSTMYAHQQQWTNWALADYRSGRHEVKTIALVDGSRLTLASNSAVDVAYGPDHRTIYLRKGEVIATVAKDAQRPFVVHSTQGSATALGTQFSVKAWSKQAVDVTVLSSKVRVCTANAAAIPCQDLIQNQTISLSTQGLSTVASVDAQAQSAWQDHILVANDMLLADVLDRVSQQQPGLTYINRQALGAQRISGVFPLNDAAQAYAAIQEFYPLQVKRYTPYVTALSIKNK